MPSPEQEYLEPLREGARLRANETNKKAHRSTEERDKAYRENPTPEEAAEYEQLDRASQRAWDGAVEQDRVWREFEQKAQDANMKNWMILYQAEETAKGYIQAHADQIQHGIDQAAAFHPCH